MRLSASIDLEAVRVDALGRIDEVFAHRARYEPFAEAYAAKVRAARAVLDGSSSGSDLGPALGPEAAIRGVTPAALARMILAKSEAATRAAIDLDARRQTAKGRVRAAVDQHAVLAVLAAVMADVETGRT